MSLAQLSSCLMEAVSANQMSATDAETLLSRALQAAAAHRDLLGASADERRARLQNARKAEIQAMLESHPGGRSAAALDLLLSCRDKARFIHGSILSALSERLAFFSRKIGPGKVDPRAMARELYDVDTNDPRAKAAAKAWRETAEFLANRLCKAGGLVERSDVGSPPSSHDPFRLAGAGFPDWLKSFDFADRAKMKKAQALDDDGLDAALFETRQMLLTDRLCCESPPFVADRPMAKDVLTFASANSFLDYQDRFGCFDLIGAMIDYIKNAARDIALFETLGPNPKATALWMAKLAGDAPEIERLYAIIADEGVWPEHRLAAEDFTSQPTAFWDRNVVSSLSDFAFLNPRRLSKLPETRRVMHYVKKLDSSNPEHQAIASRSARIVDYAISQSRKAQRFTEEFNKNGIVRWVSSATLDGFGLAAHAAIVRQIVRLEILAILADQADMPWPALEAVTQDILQQAGLDETVWNKIRCFDRLQGGFMDLIGMIRSKDPDMAKAGQALHDRVGDGVLALMPEPLRMGSKSERDNALFHRFLQQGERSGVSLLAAASLRAWHRASGAGRLQGLVDIVQSALSLGALSVQLKQIAAGEKLCDIHDVNFWGAAFILGGGFGVYGDFLQSGAFATMNDPAAPDERSVAMMLMDEAAGPLGPSPAGRIRDETAFGAEAIRRIKDQMEGSSLYYLKLALDRAIFAHLCLAADPTIETGLAEIKKAAEQEAERQYRQARINAARRSALQ